MNTRAVEQAEAGAVALIAFGAAAVLGHLVAHGRTRELDRRIRRRLRSVRSPALSRAATLVTHTGGPPAQISLAALAALALRRQRHTRTFIALAPLCASVLAVMTHRSVKLFFKRGRPPGALLRGKTEPSFPSGHATVTMATVATTAYVLAHDRIVRPGRASALLALPICVGLSRAYLDKHWSSDVAAGWLIGAGIGASLAMGIEAAEGRSATARSRAPAIRRNKSQELST